LRGGRPKKTEDSKKGSYTVLTGRQRLFIIKAWDEKTAAGVSTRTARGQIAKHLSCSPSAVKATVNNRAHWEQWCSDREVAGCTSPAAAKKHGDNRSKLKRGSDSKGCRKAGARGYLGRTDWCRPLVQAVRVWSEMEAEQGHDLTRQDLYTHFWRLLSSAVAFAEDAKEAGSLSPEQAVELQQLQKKQAKLSSCAAARNWQQRYLVGQCSFAERKKQRTTPLTAEQERQRVRTGWQHFDRLLWLTGCGTAEHLEEYVLQPERWIMQRRRTTISMSDQVPVWLMHTGSRKLV
jgi:hypothetical protein